MAYSDEGYFPRLRGVLTKMMRQSEVKYGTLVGIDERGSKYYENNDFSIPKNRWVEFAEDTFDKRWDWDASDVPAEWHRWLHNMTDDPPTPEGVEFTKRKFITEHVRNNTGTVDLYVPYTTTRTKIEAWE